MAAGQLLTGGSPYFDESQAAEAKHTVITAAKAMGRINKYLQLTTVSAAKQRANAQPMPRVSDKVSAGRLPSCQASMAAKQIKHADGKSSGNKEIPIRPVEPMQVKVNGPH